MTDSRAYRSRESGAPASGVSAARILSAIAILLFLFVIFAPQTVSDVSARYSSYSAGPGGTRGLYELLERIGFSTSRNEKALSTPPDSASTYVLIAPAQPLTSFEENRLLGAVRNGSVLVFTWDSQTLADSLGFDLSSPSNEFYTLAQAVVAGGNPDAPDSPLDATTVFRASVPIAATVTSRTPTGNQAFLWLDPSRFRHRSERAPETTALDSVRRPALVLGHKFGRGYAIAVAPADILMNQALRQSLPAIAIVRAIQYANSSLGRRSNRVVFDEYHHGLGNHADMVAAIEHALGATPLGRVTLEVLAAAIVLLLAFAVRPLAPVSVPPVSRRSPIEHVGALAHAYSRVHARALGAQRLVRGLRRRHPLGLSRAVPDNDYLATLRSRIPSVSADVERISTAIAAHSPDSSDRFATIGEAVANIERAFRE
ncbi:MAG TPA: DUF4350 domain-containing protein [Gemmatimonadaceae bacterium]